MSNSFLHAYKLVYGFSDQLATLCIINVDFCNNQQRSYLIKAFLNFSWEARGTKGEIYLVCGVEGDKILQMEDTLTKYYFYQGTLL